LLDDPRYRRAAQQIQAEIQVMPTAQKAIERIQALPGTTPSAP
jgi:UDP:flavonoid glycosyltransferase YjiC (YdhE family)